MEDRKRKLTRSGPGGAGAGPAAAAAGAAGAAKLIVERIVRERRDVVSFMLLVCVVLN